MNLRHILIILTFGLVSGCCSFRELKRERNVLFLYDAEKNTPLPNVFVGVSEKIEEVIYESKTNKKGKFILSSKWDYNTPCNRLPYFRPTLIFKQEDFVKKSSRTQIIWKDRFPLNGSAKVNGDTIFLNI